MLDGGTPLILWSPKFSMERGLVEPGLVHVDDSLSALQLAQQHPSILLSLDQASIRISLGCIKSGLAVAHVELELHHLLDLINADIIVVKELGLFLDLASI